MFSFSLSILLFFFCFNSTFSQCISSFPYSEGFESSTGGWTSGGLNSDWVWGTPSKATISSAGGGTKCWIPGGLTATFYNLSQQSYVISPCFDFSSLDYPHISFKIFWEVEKKFDGGNFQYSTDNGSTWNNVGSYFDSSDCMNSNWFNDSSIKYLNTPVWIPVKEGWSGNIQSTAGNCLGGSGSGNWLTAQHCMPYLAGVAAVLFRFTLGTGSTCNSYDGIAFDDIVIKNAPDNQPAISYSCDGNTISFAGSGSPCPSGFSWNFGDSASGTSNTSALQNPAHTFSAPGIYTITLTASGPCNPPGTVTQTIEILEFTIDSVKNVSCNSGSDGYVSVDISSGFSPFSYSWSNGLTSQAAGNLSAGTYSITVSDNIGCSAIQSVTITEPLPLTVSFSAMPSGCGMSNGSATAAVSGGSSPYSYLWNNNQPAATVTGIPAGIYTITITDAALCTLSSTITVNNTSAPSIFLSSADPDCYNGTNGSATVNASGGASPYMYQWSPNANGQQSQTVTGLVAGIYFVTVSDANGCEAFITDTIDNPPPLTVTIIGKDFLCEGETIILTVDKGNSFIWSNGDSTISLTINPITDMVYSVTATTECGPVSDSINIYLYPATVISTSGDTTITSGYSVELVASGGSSYLWSTSANTSSILVNPVQNTTYFVTVTDINGCSDTASIEVTVIEPEKFHASVSNIFSPNNDGYNDYIFVHGTGIDEFKFVIYSRWGEKIFETNDLSVPWDGTHKGKPLNSGVFAYYLFVTFRNESTYKEKGNITLLR